MSLSLSGLDPEVRERAQLALDWAAYYRIPVTVTSTMRTWANQTQLRAQYEGCLAAGETIAPSNPHPGCRYPANRPGDSSHNFGLAFDSVVPDAYWPWWIYLRKWAGFHVPDNDRIHAEVPSWRNFATQVRRG
jgi:hypothetical protein